MARPNRSGLTPEVIRAERNKGLNRVQIAEKYGVSPQYVSMITPDSIRTPVEMTSRMFPWDVPDRFQRSTPHKRLNDHLKYTAGAGKGWPVKRRSLLRGFYRKLETEGLVVEFDPEIPPIPNVAYTGGWAYRKRLDSDGDLIIRLNRLSREMSDEELDVWEFPAIRP